MATNDTTETKKTEKTLLLTMAIVVAVVAVIAAIGFIFMNKPDDMIEGQVEGTTVRISGKLPGRVVEFFAEEGDTVHAGDTLVHIHSSLVDAQLTQAEALKEVAVAQNRKVDAGTRSQIIQAAYDLLQQANAAVTITEKTYRRMENLYKEGVMSEQKRDEAKAAYDAAVAAKGAAESQYSLAKAGAQKEDKESTAALVSAAGGGVAQVQAVLEDSYLTAPFDGTIDQIYPQEGELVALGSPIMSLLRKDKRWITFNVREELLNDLTMGKKINVMVPALDRKEIEAEIYYIRDMGSYATWHSTKASGSWDSRTFEIKARPTAEIDGLRPGMSIVYK
ncbi:HlyD family secretion protein [Muribaculum intestinale]|jgi:HlyD family secretion protein|uniref:HlyD family secretion protein n=1 Tax=Muribaculum intestinale TaxID=1796646 RepID=UPI00243069C4|nr:efflux RND transporter periplasmic adaptor subunit [Muribaculum intestinale]